MVLPWLNYAGQSVEELLSLETLYRTDSLVCAFEQALQQKEDSQGLESLTVEEVVVLAVEALEREVNNGGYDQFFFNASRRFTPAITFSLKRIGCPNAARITEEAIETVGLKSLGMDAIRQALRAKDQACEDKLNKCDQAFYDNYATESIEDRLLEFIKANKAKITFLRSVRPN